MKVWQRINHSIQVPKVTFAIALALAVWAVNAISPDPALAVQPQAESVAEAMRDFSREIIAAYERRDTKTLKNFYAQQPGALFFWERKLTYSWSEIDRTMDALVQAVASLKLSTGEFRSGGSGNNGWFAATFQADRVTPDGKKFSTEGRWTVIAERRDGRWLIVHEHTSFPLKED